MPESTEAPKKEKIEVIAHPAVVEFDNKASYIARIQHPRFKDSKGGVKEKFEVILPVPDSLEEFNARYSDDEASNMTFADVARYAVQNFSTRPNWYAAGFNEEGELLPKGHEAMQAEADAFRIGKPKAKKATLDSVTKAKATKLDSFEEQARAKGFASLEEYIQSLQKKAKK